jgi:hypothetical protein
MNNSDLGLPLLLGPFASLSSMTISKQVYLPNLSAGLSYNLDTYAPFGYTVTEAYQIQTSSGTVTAALKINGTSITGLSSISVSSTPQNVAATGANTVSVGNTLSLVFSSNSSAANIQLTLAATRTS